MVMRIELARREDVAAILDIANWAAANTPANFALQPEPLDDWLALFDRTQEKYPWLVARDGERVIGFAKGGPHKPRGAYAWTVELSVYIHPDHHQRGIGRKLYEKLIPLLKAQGFATLIAGIAMPHPPSEKLHQAFGFAKCATFHRAGFKFGRWWDVSYWELHLDANAGGDAQPLKPVREVYFE
jgi:L-amino acid N-acyltransferase YncA